MIPLSSSILTNRCYLDNEYSFSEGEVPWRETGDLVSVFGGKMYYECRKDFIFKTMGKKVFHR